jgi:hypothetical protein
MLSALRCLQLIHAGHGRSARQNVRALDDSIAASARMR